MATSQGPISSKPRPYKRILTSALHTRFVQATSLTYTWTLLLACLATGNLGVFGIFWSLFPLGPAGIKAGLFCLSSVCIFILEIATLNVGRRITPSNFTTLKSSLFSYSTYATFFWYFISAWWFCEVYVFTASSSKQLGWILHGGYGDPDRLNERPIYLRAYFLLVAIVGALFHLYHDRSSLHIRITQPATPQTNEQKTHPESGVTAQVQAQLTNMIARAGIASGVCTILGPFVYTGLLRSLFWNIHVVMAKTFVSISRSDAQPPRGFYIGNIMVRAAVFGFLLCFTWELTLLFFHTHMIQEPTKKGAPLSSASKDPNGTLMNGIAAKRDLTKTFALWEFAIIAQNQPERRKAIFADIDRPTGPVFKSMLESALKVVANIDDRIKAKDSSPAPTPPEAASKSEVQHLPRLLPDSKKYDKSIFAPPLASTRSERIENFLNKEIQSIGSSPKPWSPPVDDVKQRLRQAGKLAMEEYSRYDAAAMQTPLGHLMLTTPERIINSVIFGSPIGNAALVVDAVESITKMLVASLNEDTFGKAVAGVPVTVKQFTNTIDMIELFVAKHAPSLLPKRQFDEAEVTRELKEVITVHARLKQGLRELLAAFHVFLNDVGLAIKDLNEAKAAAAQRDLLPPLPASNGNASAAQKQANGIPRQPAVQRAMEEVGGVSRRPAKGKEREHEPTTHKTMPSRQPPAQIASAPGSAASTGFDRPGRLFSQLDPGSAYSEKFHPQPVASGSRQPGSSNTVPARLRSGNAAAEVAGNSRMDNVFGARDPNTSASKY